MLTCAAWAYPLCGQPVLRTAPGVFVLSCPPGGTVRNYIITLRSGEALGDAEALAEFEAALENFADVRSPRAAVASAGSPAPVTAEPLKHPAPDVALAARATPFAAASPVLAGAQALGSGLRAAGAVTRSVVTGVGSLVGRGITSTAAAVAAHLPPASAPLTVSPATMAGLDHARTATRATVVVTAGMVEAGAALARGLGAWAAAAATSALAGTGGARALAGAHASPVGRAVQTVGASGMVAFKDVWDGLEDAARLVGGAGAQATRTLMHARYGDAGNEVTDASIGIAGDLGEVALNVRQMGVKGIIRKTAAEAAMAALGGGGGGGEPLLIEQGAPQLQLEGSGGRTGGGGGGCAPRCDAESGK